MGGAHGAGHGLWVGFGVDGAFHRAELGYGQGNVVGWGRAFHSVGHSLWVEFGMDGAFHRAECSSRQGKVVGGALWEEPAIGRAMVTEEQIAAGPAGVRPLCCLPSPAEL